MGLNLKLSFPLSCTLPLWVIANFAMILGPTAEVIALDTKSSGLTALFPPQVSRKICSSEFIYHSAYDLRWVIWFIAGEIDADSEKPTSLSFCVEIDLCRCANVSKWIRFVQSLLRQHTMCVSLKGLVRLDNSNYTLILDIKTKWPENT